MKLKFIPYILYAQIFIFLPCFIFPKSNLYYKISIIFRYNSFRTFTHHIF